MHNSPRQRRIRCSSSHPRHGRGRTLGNWGSCCGELLTSLVRGVKLLVVRWLKELVKRLLDGDISEVEFMRDFMPGFENHGLWDEGLAYLKDFTLLKSDLPSLRWQLQQEALALMRQRRLQMQQQQRRQTTSHQMQQLTPTPWQRENARKLRQLLARIINFACRRCQAFSGQMKERVKRLLVGEISEVEFMRDFMAEFKVHGLCDEGLAYLKGIHLVKIGLAFASLATPAGRPGSHAPAAFANAAAAAAGAAAAAVAAAATATRTVMERWVRIWVKRSELSATIMTSFLPRSLSLSHTHTHTHTHTRTHAHTHTPCTIQQAVSCLAQRTQLWHTVALTIPQYRHDSRNAWFIVAVVVDVVVRVVVDVIVVLVVFLETQQANHGLFASNSKVLLAAVGIILSTGRERLATRLGGSD